MATALGGSQSLATGQMICLQTSTNVGTQDARIRARERALTEDGRHSNSTHGTTELESACSIEQHPRHAGDVDIPVRGGEHDEDPLVGSECIERAHPRTGDPDA